MSSSQGRTARPSSDVFAPGALVEVSSNEDGFRGSWFSGTVISRLPNNKILVEYDNLLADDDSSDHLREVLSRHQLRPLPPADAGAGIKFGEEVDAFHNDGWWEGHVTMELGGGRFLVYFRGSREQMEFSKEDLRVHREWLNGTWDPPIEQQQQQEVVFNLEVLSALNRSSNNEAVREEEEEEIGVGKLVEVSSDDEGFRGAWFTATVVQVVAKDKFLVEYHTLLDDDSQLLKEEVDIFHVRPRPPETRAREFSYFQEVDALYNDGWWVGVVTKVLGNSLYMVYFRTSDERLEFKCSELRPHQDWIGGKWVMASKALKL